MAIRIALAERLADEVNTPHDLILMLVDDTIEVARPLILRSPLLTEKDTLRLIAESGIAHQEAVAARGPISANRSPTRWSPAIPRSVLVALVRNATAQISESGYRNAGGYDRAPARSAGPWCGRPDLPPVLATSMCEWVSDALKAYIAKNYAISSSKLDKAIDQAETQVKDGTRPVPRIRHRRQFGQKLVEKLASSGQLKAGFLMRVLQSGPD